MIKTVSFSALEPGLHLLVFGAIHGNEKCGTAACLRAIGELDSGALKLAHGRLTMIPICNPRAYAADTRFIERNLNRYMVPVENPDSYEARIGNILCPLLADCDALLDIHSYTIGGAPFISYAGAIGKERAFAAVLGAEILLTGWDDVYAVMGRGRAVSKEEATGGPQNARRHGAIAVTLECGQHRDPQSAEIAYRGIVKALSHLGMLETAPQLASAPAPKHVHMTHVFYRDAGGEFPKDWKNFEHAKKGEILARYPDGKNILASENGFVIMPKADCPEGEEWFYFGVEDRG